MNSHGMYVEASGVFLFFIAAAPTLCYETRWPRTKAVRWWYVAKELLQYAICCVGVVVLFATFIVPTMLKSTTRTTLMWLAADGLALILPSFLAWILMCASSFSSSGLCPSHAFSPQVLRRVPLPAERELRGAAARRPALLPGLVEQREQEQVAVELQIR